jgi:hypothetical protein
MNAFIINRLEGFLLQIAVSGVYLWKGAYIIFDKT